MLIRYGARKWDCCVPKDENELLNLSVKEMTQGFIEHEEIKGLFY